MPTMPDAAPIVSRVPSGVHDTCEAMAAWYLRKSHRVVWELPLTVALVAFIWMLLLRGALEDPKSNLHADQMALMALAPPPVPNEENAAVDFALAEKALVPWTGGMPLDYVEKGTEYFERSEVLAYVANNVLAMQHLHAAAAKSKCNWGLDYSRQPMGGGPGKLFDVVWLLAADARVNAHAGNHKAAAKSMAALNRIAEHRRSDPMLASCEGCLLGSEADRTLQAIIYWDTPARLDDLGEYRAAVRMERRGKEAAVRGLELEKIERLWELDHIANGDLPRPDWLPKLGPLALGKGWDVCYGHERRCLEAVLDEAIAISARGEWLTGWDLAELVSKHQTGPAPYTAMVTRYAGDRLPYWLHHEEQAIVADTALAFLMFRAKHCRDVESLAELVPEFLPAVPKGMATQRPLAISAGPGGPIAQDAEGSPVRLFSEVIVIDSGSPARGTPETFFRSCFRIPPIGQHGTERTGEAR